MSDHPWLKMAEQSLEASKKCLENDLFRSACSRAYYAIFAAATSVYKIKGHKTNNEREAWGHTQIQEMAKRNFTQFLGYRGIEIVKYLRITYNARLLADYSSVYRVGREDAMESVRLASASLKEFSKWHNQRTKPKKQSRKIARR